MLTKLYLTFPSAARGDRIQRSTAAQQTKTGLVNKTALNNSVAAVRETVLSTDVTASVDRVIRNGSDLKNEINI